MRSISNVVDVTNYLMLALGSPLHAFDFETLARRPDRRPSRASRREARTLDGVLRKLEPGPADRRRRARGRARRDHGRRGDRGLRETTSLLLEAANFEPVGILRSSERLALRTEGSNRWEKGVDPYLGEPGRDARDAALVGLAGARWTGASDVHGELPRAGRGSAAGRERTSAMLGLDVAAERAGGDPRAPRLRAREGTVSVPSWRARDVTREVDLVEEVARVVLDEVPFTLPRRESALGRLTRWQRLRRRVEDVLVGCGFYEAYTPCFVAGIRRRRSCGCPSRSRSRLRRCARRCGRASSRPRVTTSRSATPTSRSSRSRARIARSRATIRTSAGTSPGSPRAALRRRSGPSSSCMRRSRRNRRSRAPIRAVPASRASRRGRPRAGSASSIRRCSRARGARSSSTSTRSSRPRRRRSPSWT